jgi:hypothetical protein
MLNHAGLEHNSCSFSWQMETEDFDLYSSSVSTIQESNQEPSCTQLSTKMRFQCFPQAARYAQSRQPAKKNLNTINQSCHIWSPPAGVCASKSQQIEDHIKVDLTKEEEVTVTAAIQSGAPEVHTVLFLKALLPSDSNVPSRTCDVLQGRSARASRA